MKIEEAFSVCLFNNLISRHFSTFSLQKKGENRRKERKSWLLTSENSKHVKVIKYNFMKMRDVVSIDMNQGRFWKAEQLLQQVQHTLPFQPASYLLM